jgi:hypothetical protein
VPARIRASERTSQKPERAVEPGELQLRSPRDSPRSPLLSIAMLASVYAISIKQPLCFGQLQPSQRLLATLHHQQRIAELSAQGVQLEHGAHVARYGVRASESGLEVLHLQDEPHFIHLDIAVVAGQRGRDDKQPG